jgi:hypothetical protein
MIETNFDNCVGPLHCVCRTKFFSWGREKACPLTNHKVKRSALFINTRATVYTANFVQWPLLKCVARELKVRIGTTQLEQLIIIFRGPFVVNVCLMIILFI